MNAIPTSLKCKITQYTKKCKKFSIDEDERRTLKIKEDLIRKSLWVNLSKPC
jgi:hypothetical protein